MPSLFLFKFYRQLICCVTGALCYRYTDPKTRKLHQARVAVQLCVKPGAYKVGSAHISDTDVDGTVEQIDAKFSNSELEWSTKERGSTSLCALLIRID